MCFISQLNRVYPNISAGTNDHGAVNGRATGLLPVCTARKQVGVGIDRVRLKCDGHAQKPVFVFRRNGRVHLNRQGRQFSRLLAAELCASAVVMLDTPSSEVVWRGLATHSTCQFPFHFPSRASPCAITFQTQSTNNCERCRSLNGKETGVCDSCERCRALNGKEKQGCVTVVSSVRL